MAYADLDQVEFWEKFNNDPNAILLDVRTPEEYADGHIPNSVLLDYKDPAFTVDVLDLDTDKNYYVYCRSGGRSKAACHILLESGIENAYNLLGGFSQWNGPKQ